MLSQDSEVVFFDRASFNQGINAQYVPMFTTDVTTTLVAKGPGGWRSISENTKTRNSGLRAYCAGNGQLDGMTMATISNTLDTMHDQQIVIIIPVREDRTGE